MWVPALSPSSFSLLNLQDQPFHLKKLPFCNSPRAGKEQAVPSRQIGQQRLSKKLNEAEKHLFSGSSVGQFMACSQSDMDAVCSVITGGY